MKTTVNTVIPVSKLISPSHISRVWKHLKALLSQYRMWYPQQIKVAVADLLDGNLSYPNFYDPRCEIIYSEIRRHVDYLLKLEAQQRKIHTVPTCKASVSSDAKKIKPSRSPFATRLLHSYITAQFLKYTFCMRPRLSVKSHAIINYGYSTPLLLVAVASLFNNILCPTHLPP